MASEPGPKRLTNVARIATPSRPAVRTHARPPRAMARQKEQPEPTNGRDPPRGAEEARRRRRRGLLVRPRPRRRETIIVLWNTGVLRPPRSTFVRPKAAEASPSRAPPARPRESRSPRRGLGVARARAPARSPRAVARARAPPHPSSPRAGEPRAFSASKAPLPSAHRPIPRLPTQSCKRTRLKKFFSPGRACCAECLKVRPEARPAGRPPRSRAEPPDPRRSPAQILTTKHTVERQNAGRAPSFVPGSETRRRSFSGSFSIAPVGLGTRGTRTKKTFGRDRRRSIDGRFRVPFEQTLGTRGTERKRRLTRVRAGWIETNRETTV